MNDKLEKLTQDVAELRKLILLAIPESRLPHGVVHPPRKPVFRERPDMPPDELVATRRAEIVRSLRYLVALRPQERRKRRLPGTLSDFPVFIAIESEMGVRAPLPPVTYRSALVNLLTLRSVFRREGRDAIERTLRDMETDGTVVCKPLGEFLPRSGSNAPAVMLAEDAPAMDLLLNGPPFTLADVKQAIRCGAEWWTENPEDAWKGPRRERPAAVALDPDDGWVEDHEDPVEDDEPQDVVPVKKKKPQAEPGSWAVGGVE